MTRKYTVNPYKKLKLIMLNSRRNWRNNVNDYMLYAIIMNESDTDIDKVMRYFSQDKEVGETIKIIRDAYVEERDKFRESYYMWKKNHAKEDLNEQATN